MRQPRFRVGLRRLSARLQVQVLALAGAPPDANYIPASPEVDAIFYNPNITQVERAELFFNTSTPEGKGVAPCFMMA